MYRTTIMSSLINDLKHLFPLSLSSTSTCHYIMVCWKWKLTTDLNLRVEYKHLMLHCLTVIIKLGYGASWIIDKIELLCFLGSSQSRPTCKTGLPNTCDKASYTHTMIASTVLDSYCILTDTFIYTHHHFIEYCNKILQFVDTDIKHATNSKCQSCIIGTCNCNCAFRMCTRGNNIIS